MILEWDKVRVFVKPGATDMRKQINGLSIIVAEQLGMDPLDGSLFLFCNRQRRILKVASRILRSFRRAGPHPVLSFVLSGSLLQT